MHLIRQFRGSYELVYCNAPIIGYPLSCVHFLRSILAVGDLSTAGILHMGLDNECQSALDSMFVRARMFGDFHAMLNSYYDITLYTHGYHMDGRSNVRYQKRIHLFEYNGVMYPISTHLTQAQMEAPPPIQTCHEISSCITQ